MKRLFYSSLLFSLLLTAAANFGGDRVYAQNRADRGLVAQAQNISGDTFPFAAETPNGARVYSYKRPSRQMIQAVDDGLTALFDVDEKNGYRRGL